MQLDQRRIDELYTASVNAVLDLLEDNAVLRPVVFMIGDDGELAVLDEAQRMRSTSQAVVDHLVQDLRDQVSQRGILATALALPARVQDQPGEPERDVIVVQLRAANFSLDMVVPYFVRLHGLWRRTRQAELGEAQAHEVDNDVFV